jgi:hypothetical protein
MRATQSVEDGIPTRERGNDVVRLWVIHRGRPWGCRVPRGAWLPIAIGRGSVQDGIPTRERGNEVLRLLYTAVPVGVPGCTRRVVGQGDRTRERYAFPTMAGMGLSLLVPTLRRGNAVFDAPRRHLE